MLYCKNANLELSCCENGTGITITDCKTGQSWTIDENSLVYGGVDNDGGYKTPFNMLCPLKAEKIDESQICVTYIAGDNGGVTLIYEVCDDFVEVVLSAEMDGKIGAVSLPGSFNPTGDAKKYLLPIMQGMLWDGRGEAFESRVHESGHTGFSMAMFGIMGERGGLLMAAETSDDVLWWMGKNDNGSTWLTNIQVDSLGTMRYDRRVRIYLTQPSITDIAKAYRRRVIERGRFKSWEEKIAERPALKRLFGALMCFIGYCQDDLDYAAECEKLKAYGFDKALLYPIRFNAYSDDFLMGGQPPIHLDKATVSKIKALGYDVAPWSWINEGINDGSADMQARYRHDRNGDTKLTWQIDEHKWYSCCTSRMADYQNNANADKFADMTWDHFDVITCATNNECHCLEHKNHYGIPLSKSEDRQWLRKLLLAGQASSRAVSSEGFNDAYSLEYDMGSVKAFAQYGPWEYWPIPLTMLVYHDSMMHTWWEVHNYNSRFFGRECGRFQYGGGRTRLMAAMDALYGCMPDVFPFGAQYGWTGKGSETYLYKFRFEDAETQLALQLALPVARLHEEIGMLEMTDFEFVTGDGYVQKTTFADGTTVYANFGTQQSQYIEGVGGIQPESWVVVKKK